MKKPAPMPPSPLDRALRKLGEAPGATHPTTLEARKFVAHVASAPLMRERHARTFGFSFEELDVATAHFKAFIDFWPQSPAEALAAGRAALPPGDRD